jgi:signal peptidase II
VTRRVGLALLALTVVLDQLSKSWVVDYFDAQGPVIGVPQRVVTPFFNLILTWNRGMSFGLFNSDTRLNAIIFTVLAAIIVTGLVIWLRQVRQGLLALAIGLVIGGAIGNVIDRLLRGAVVDFLDFYLGQWHFYVFNLADAAISVGVALMVLDSLLARAKAAN